MTLIIRWAINGLSSLTIAERFGKTHNDRHCIKCYLDHKPKCFRMDAHEYSLPPDLIYTKTMVFELSYSKAVLFDKVVKNRILNTFKS
jgi:hypothetical protein